MSVTGLLSLSYYIISVGYRYGNIHILCFWCRLLVWCHSHVTLLVSDTGLVSFFCHIIGVGYRYGNILMLCFWLRLLVWCHSHVTLLVSAICLVSFFVILLVSGTGMVTFSCYVVGVGY